MGSFTNPVLPGFNPDPSIVRVGEDYFCVTSSFEYFPGAPIYHSKDLIKWKLIGHALTRKSQLDIKTPEPGGGVWATTIRHYQDSFYIITNSFDRYRPQADDRVWPRGFYVKTNNIWDDSTWSDPVYFDQIGFDHDLFWDDDGLVYLSSTYRKVDRAPDSKLKDFGIHISTVELDTGTLTCAPVLVRESSSGVAEGSHLFKRNGYYYLFTAEGGTESGHCEYVSRSRESPFGPWEQAPHNPLWRNTTENEVQNTGHCDLVEDTNGQWWALCLGVRPRREGNEWRTSVFGRESLLLPVRWEDDWPIFNEGKPVTLQMNGPGMYTLQEDKVWKDDFAGEELSLGWYRKNTPVRKDYSLTDRPGCLTLHGGPYTLAMPTSPTLFLRKQRQWPVVWKTELDFELQTTRVEAGTVVWWNYTCFASIGIRLRQHGSQTQKVVRFTPPANTDDHVEELIGAHGRVKFMVDCTEGSYRFGFKEVDVQSNGEWKWLGAVDTQVLTRNPDVGQPFTGMMLGLYSFGELQPALVPAHFTYAEFGDHLG
ncbi:glycoside hydrolase family 43 protein [Dothidotthia symphoricarpi CBS 119687]|uniref:Glycoside hydrolase family 43 protein n=1 Tax=Dothidotthia symphoricarpi CBS 119687 TaxID=1392245 RepID=A0A6A6AG69_9PLEO|nr:glycoside hydrolase family 43 protein [Dothidotthia symphoricarpi CBS 119687]KAF2130909.1 glycoside hydrolase family 43 protein [Dothidotthia symphoricarpi CBS 119687]